MTDTPSLPPDRTTIDAAQQTLLEYQAILNNAPVGILFTRDRKVLSCNPKFSELFGWQHGELIGQPGSVFYLSAQEYAGLGRVASPILATGAMLDQEMTMRRKDGSVLFCHMRAKAVNPEKTEEGTIWIAEDISARKAAQAELEEAVFKQQAILENASAGIVFTSNGKIELCNPQADRLYGWDPGKLLGQKAEVLFANTEDYARFGQEVGGALASGQLIDVEWKNARQDGTLFWCRNLARALPTSDGSRRTIWIVEDISEKKAAREALDNHQHELETRVRERTEELAETNAHLLMEIAERREIEKHLRASETRFRDVSETTSDWFWEQDANFRFIEMSSGLLATNLKPQLTMGKTRQELPILGLTEAQWREHIETIEAHQPFKNFVYQMQTTPGELRWFSISGKPVFEDGVFTGYRGSGTDITERKVSEEKIAFLAYHDPLTGLPNRLLLQDRVLQAIAQADRKKTGVALLFLDLDNFKKINDSLGHAAGDALLKEVAARLHECVRETDTISRQGGDEFVIVLSDLSDQDAAIPVLAKIMERLQDPFTADGKELTTTVSIGVTVYPEDGVDFETLGKKADMAMYQAKEAGRNTYRFFDETMNSAAVEHLVLRNGLRRALERGEFQLYYQPQIDMTNGSVFGTEALIRWNHPELGLISPAKFIPVAEESGLIIPIGEWVLHEACKQAVKWKEAGFPPLLMAVNLSTVQFRRGNVEQVVINALNESGLAPCFLELELTESTLIENVEQVLATVKRLKQLGVKLAIDDFGTGYSSLSYLKQFDADKLKIDQSFIRDLATDPDDAAIVNAIIQMAHNLNLKVIAEGVENLETLQYLHQLRCDQAQGFHFARPMPAVEFEKYLLKAIQS